MADATSTARPPGVRLERDGAVAYLVLDNPARHNALNAAMWAAIPVCMREAEADPEIRVIVLKGAGGKAFSAGADISEFDSARTGDAARDYDALNHAAFEALLGAAKPTIAMIGGFCLGGGFGIAACCDLRLADDTAQFSIPAARLGLGYHPRWIKPLLALAPAPRIKELLFTGWRFSAAEALTMGLVNRVVPPADLDTATRALARAIAENAPLTVKAAKAAIDAMAAGTGEADMKRLEAMIAACFASDDYAEGRQAFAEKRKPQFRGR